MVRAIAKIKVNVSPRDRKRILTKTGKIIREIPKIGRRSVRSVAKQGRRRAKEIIRMKESSFSWAGKGELANSFQIVPGRQNKRKSEVKLIAGAPHALLAEEGSRSGKIPVRRRWSAHPKLISWVQGLMSATGKSHMPGIITVSATASTNVRPNAWGAAGMRYMEGAFNFMTPLLKRETSKIAKKVF